MELIDLSTFAGLLARNHALVLVLRVPGTTRITTSPKIA